MLGGGVGSVFAVPESCMDRVPCPSKRSLSLSLGQKGRRSKVPKFDPITSNGSRDLIDSKASSRAVAVSQNLTGLTNVANTCYANAVVQALRFCPGFREGLAGACSASLSTSGPHPIATSLLQVSASNSHNTALCSIHSFLSPFIVIPTDGYSRYRGSGGQSLRLCDHFGVSGRGQGLSEIILHVQTGSCLCCCDVCTSSEHLA